MHQCALNMPKINKTKKPNATMLFEELKEIEMKREYTKKYKDTKHLISQVATTVVSSRNREDYSSIEYEDYIIDNRDFEVSATVMEEEPRDTEKSVKVKELKGERNPTKISDTVLQKRAKIIAKEIGQVAARFPIELAFSLLDQSYSPLGTYGYWKYREVWQKDLLQFQPETKINKTGRLIGVDDKPLFCTHIDFAEKKLHTNILFEDLNVGSYRKARKLLIKWAKIKKEDLKNHKFLLIVKPQLECIARDLEEKKLKKEEVSDLLVTLYLKKLRWALMLDAPVKPLIYQIRKEPEFEAGVLEDGVLKDNSPLKSSAPVTQCVLSSDMRCNIGIGDWKKIIGSFEDCVKEEINY